jgi:amino acid transporter
VALVLALTGSFVMMAVVSAVARLVTYTGTCAATLILRRERYRQRVKEATFVIPLGPLIPTLAILISMILLIGATREQLLGGGAALAAGAGLYLLNRAGREKSAA